MPRAEKTAEAQALRRRARRFRVAAAWVGLAAMLLISASFAATRSDPAIAKAFMSIHVPASAVAGLQAAGVPVVQVPAARVASEGDHWRVIAGNVLRVLMAFAVVWAFFQRQWALLATASVIFLVGPIAGRPPPPTQPLAWELYQVWVSWQARQQQGDIAGLASASALQAHRVHEHSAPPWLVDVAKPDAAYLLAQSAYLDRRPAEVQWYLAAMGPDYPQTDRIVRARIEAMVDFLRAQHVDLRGPHPAERTGLPIQVQRKIGATLPTVAGLVAVASLALSTLSGKLCRRARRMDRLVSTSPAPPSIIASAALSLRLPTFLDARTDEPGLGRRAQWLARTAGRAAVASVLLALWAYAICAPDPGSGPAFHDIDVTYHFNSDRPGLWAVSRPATFRPAETSGPSTEVFSAERYLHFFLDMAQALTALAALVLLILGRSRWALACLGAILFLRQISWNDEFRHGYRVLPAQSVAQAIVELQRPASEVDPLQRQLLRLAVAEAAYIDQDAPATARALSQLDPKIEIPVAVTQVRVAVMREWAEAHGQRIAPGALRPRVDTPLPLKRLAAGVLWTICGVSLVGAAASAALAAVIRLRLRRLGALATAPAV